MRLRSSLIDYFSNQCSWTQYKNCLPYFSVMNASDCIENCLPSCERIRYKTYSITSSLFAESVAQYANGHGCFGEQLFGANTFQYQYYEDQYDASFFSFVAGLGGTLGILLGIDVMMIIEYCFYSMHRFYAFISWLKTQHMKKTEERPHGKIIRFGKKKNVIHVQPSTEHHSVLIS